MATTGLYFYVLIEKETNRCFQTLDTNTPDFSVNDDYAYSMQVEIHTNDYLDKYYYDDIWHSRAWNECDADDNPVEASGFVDTEWIPVETPKNKKTC